RVAMDVYSLRFRTLLFVHSATPANATSWTPNAAAVVGLLGATVVYSTILVGMTSIPTRSPSTPGTPNWPMAATNTRNAEDRIAGIAIGKTMCLMVLRGEAPRTRAFSSSEASILLNIARTYRYATGE